MELLDRHYSPQRGSQVKSEEGPDTLRNQMTASISQAEDLTFETVGIDMGFMSSPESRSYLFISGKPDGLAVTLRCLGNVAKVQATRKPRMNMH
jgi:hypothetical protein